MSTQNKRMWCYQCHSSVNIPADKDLNCTTCASDFLEELSQESQAPEAYQRDNHDQGVEHVPSPENFLERLPLLQLLAGVVQTRTRHANDNDNDDDNDPAASTQLAVMDLLLRAVLSGNGGIMDLPLQGNRDDYAWGENGVHDILQQLFQNSEEQGAPPVTEQVMDSLPVGRMSATACGDPCPICQAPIVVDAEIITLPCTHVFCDTCISPWLRLHATCPVCRLSLVPEEAPKVEELESQA